MELGVETSKPNIIITLVTDIVLLLIMLVGLLYMGLGDGGKLDIGRLLWKQVGSPRLPVVAMLSIH